jgi:ParB/RepB/Spo0J family partition protein
MTKRRSDEQQAQAIKARLAQRTHGVSAPVLPAASEPLDQAADSTDRQTQARQHFVGAQLDVRMERRAIEVLPIAQIAPELRPGLRQPRLVPLPADLIVNGATPPAYEQLVTELRELGESLRQRQIQPIVVYPGTSDIFPTARYLILIGQRRWTAAQLVGLPTIDAVVIEPPAPQDRITLQFAENEAREDFSDIERAWAMQQLRETMGSAHVGVAEVAARLNVKRSRAYQLLRLLRFAPEQQETIALLRLQERQLLPLIDALHHAQITTEQAGLVIQRLQEITVERARSSRQLADHETTIQSVETPRRSGIDVDTVARVVAHITEDARPVLGANSAPRWYSMLCDDIERLSRKLRRASERADALGPSEIAEIVARLQDLQHQAQMFADRPAQGDVAPVSALDS